MSIIDYIEDYYLPLMNIDKNCSFIQTLFLFIKAGDKKNVEKSYYELVDFIKTSEFSENQMQLINQYFNRMRFDLSSAFDLSIPYIYF
jgi:hypothetical protein